jgi:hypothetical protein
MQKEKDASVLEGARICAVFARATAVVEQHHDNDAGGHGSSRPFFAFRKISNQTEFYFYFNPENRCADGADE